MDNEHFEAQAYFYRSRVHICKAGPVSSKRSHKSKLSKTRIKKDIQQQLTENLCQFNDKACGFITGLGKLMRVNGNNVNGKTANSFVIYMIEFAKIYLAWRGTRVLLGTHSESRR